MNSKLNIVDLGRDGLLDYTVKQISNLIPDGRHALIRPVLDRYFDEALERVRRCINAVKTWEVDRFYYLHSTQYCTYLYFLSNTIWRETGSAEVPTKLFLLNKALNGIDLFYEIGMPDIFFIGHSTCIVLAKAVYSDYFVIYQNATVGKNHGVAPVIGEGVVMYPNTAVIGKSAIGKGAIISQGVSVINDDVASGCMVFACADGLLYKPCKRKIIEDFFRF